MKEKTAPQPPRHQPRESNELCPLTSAPLSIHLKAKGQGGK